MVELALLPQHLHVAPGGVGRASISLQGLDAGTAEFFLVVQGLEQSWYTLSSTRITLGVPSSVQPVIALHPPRSATAGVYPFELIARMRGASGHAARVSALLVVDTADATVADDAWSPALLATARTRTRAMSLRLMPLLERPWLIGAVVALVLILCAGAAYALRTDHQTPHAATGAARTRTVTPISSVATATAVATGTGTAMATGGSAAPYAVFPRPATGSLPTPMRPHLHNGSSRARSTATVAAGLPDAPRHPQLPGQRSQASHQHPQASSSDLPLPPQLPVTGTASPLPTESATGVPTDTPTDTPLPSATASATATSSPTSTVAVPTSTATSPTDTDTPIATDTAVATASPTTSATATASPTASASATPQPTVTPVPTMQLTATPTSGPSPAASVAPTAADSATPVEVTVQYAYTVTANQFILRWQSQNAVSASLDDRSVPVDGQQAFPLQAHTFVLTVTGADGSQAMHVIALGMSGACTAVINGQQAQVPSDQCSGAQDQAQATGTPTIGPAPALVSTAEPSTPTGTPTVAAPTVTATETATAIETATAVGGATATPDLDLPVFPTDTPTPALAVTQ